MRWSKCNLHPSFFRRAQLITSIMLMISCMCLVACSRSPGSAGTSQTDGSAGASPSRASAAVTQAEVQALCGTCHATPPAESFPRAAWVHEVELGYEFLFAAKQNELAPPPMQRVIEYFQQRAPEELVFNIPPRSPSTAISFAKQTVPLPDDRGAPGVSHILILDTAPGERPRLFFCDMSRGGLHEVMFEGETIGTRPIATTPFPCHVAPCDLDGDGRDELVLAELGSFLPEDHDQGRVIWLPQGADASAGAGAALQTGLGRVADVRPGDFDGDADQDLVVAEFGWRKTGSISLLENTGRGSSSDSWQRHILDKRHGAIHTIPCDLNNDGRLDFVSVLAQEYESVEVFLGQGQGPVQFEKRPLHTFLDPAFGSSGIEVVDLDQDDDLDVVYTNGDALDSGLPKPYHGIHWLENRGTYPFTHHHLTSMPAVHRAVAGDLDGDTDLDVVASAYLPGNPLEKFPEVPFDSLLWLEQTGPATFVPHTLESGRLQHATCALGDLDRDEDLDLVVGEFRRDAKDPTWLTIWWNQGPVQQRD